jgi:hypothetical protein
MKHTDQKSANDVIVEDAELGMKRFVALGRRLMAMPKPNSAPHSPRRKHRKERGAK